MKPRYCCRHFLIADADERGGRAETPQTAYRPSHNDAGGSSGVGTWDSTRSLSRTSTKRTADLIASTWSVAHRYGGSLELARREPPWRLEGPSSLLEGS